MAEEALRAGLSGRSWPEPYGGRGAPAWQDDVVAEVQSRYGVSTKVLSVGLEMLPPVFVQYGTDEQCLRYLPQVLSGTETWCQLLSEPDAGSDLGSATTFAAPAPGGWAVSGQKVWTSGAGTSNFALLIARTDRETPGMAGLSCLILDMAEPGVDVRPLRQMSGAYHFNEVFLEDVHVPQRVPDRQGRRGSTDPQDDAHQREGGYRRRNQRPLGCRAHTSWPRTWADVMSPASVSPWPPPTSGRRCSTSPRLASPAVLRCLRRAPSPSSCTANTLVSAQMPEHVCWGRP